MKIAKTQQMKIKKSSQAKGLKMKELLLLFDMTNNMLLNEMQKSIKNISLEVKFLSVFQVWYENISWNILKTSWKFYAPLAYGESSWFFSMTILLN